MMSNATTNITMGLDKTGRCEPSLYWLRDRHAHLYLLAPDLLVAMERHHGLSSNSSARVKRCSMVPCQIEGEYVPFGTVPE